MGKKRTTSSPVNWKVQRFAGKTFALAGKLRKADLNEATAMIKGDGGKVLSGVSTDLDYLVLGSGRQAAQSQKQAEEWNQAGQAAIRVLSLEEFFALVVPDRNLALALLRAGPKGYERWKLLTRWSKAPVDLSGSDLRGLKLKSAWFFHLNLDGADLRQVEFTHVSLYCILTRVHLDGAQLEECSFEGLLDCRLVGANLRKARFFDAILERTDFTGANLEEAALEKARTSKVIFQGANLKRVSARKANLAGANLAEADLTRADFQDCDLAGANLNQANLTETDLFQANLKGADLRNACLRCAILADADLTNARIEGADFEGANLAGAKRTGLDLSKAKGVPGAQSVPRAGKHLKELDQVARQTTRLKAAAAITLPGDVSVPVEVVSEDNGQKLFLRGHKLPFATPTSLRTPSEAMLAVVRPLLHGTLGLDSVKVTATGAPLKPKPLRELVLKAWCEACGRSAPEADRIKGETKTDKTREQDRLARVMKELRGGPAGIKRWNARTNQQQINAGPFRKIDLSGVCLDGVHLAWQLDCRRANFEGASLVKAELGHWSKFQQANFRGANLTGADLGCGRFRAACFENAVLQKSHLRVAEFLQASFRGADLTDADLAHANLRGADLTGATLTGAILERAKYDSDTRWPAGFVPPKCMIWLGR